MKKNLYYSTGIEMEKLDVLAVKSGLAIGQMMELAGWHMVNLFKLQKISKKLKITVIVGKGNKGGDGLCAARHLTNNGWSVNIILLSTKMSPDAMHQWRLLQKMKAPIIIYNRKRVQAVRIINNSNILIDSLIGYHLNGAPRGLFKDVIELMNASRKKIIAYDLPSGLDATNGACLEPTIRAYTTLSLALPKKAFKTKSGKNVSGKIYVGDIGIPIFLYDIISKGSRPPFEDSNLGLISL